MRKIIALTLAVVLTAVLASCGRGEANQNDAQNGQQNGSAKKGEVAVFYYTYSDAYISSVRTAMDAILRDNGVNFNDYDANGNQTTQTEQIQTAIAKGASALVVNVVDTGSQDAARTIVNLAKQKGIPVIFFNRSVDESVVSDYEKCVFVGTDYEMAGHMQGQMIGEYLVENYDDVDLNGDGQISYVMFKGQEGNMEAIARTQYGVEDCNKVLSENGYPELKFYDESNRYRYLVDQDGLWSSAAATNYMSTILAQYSEGTDNMVELVIANNDEMALGAVSALQSAGYNRSDEKAVPVFGVDATNAAVTAISQGTMTGTIKQDAEGMARTIVAVLGNINDGNEKFAGIDSENVVGTWRVNIPYSPYTIENEQ